MKYRAAGHRGLAKAINFVVHHKCINLSLLLTEVMDTRQSTRKRIDPPCLGGQTDLPYLPTACHVSENPEGIQQTDTKGMHSNRRLNRYRAVQDRSNRKGKPNSHWQASQHTSIGPLPLAANGFHELFPLFPILLS